MSIETELQNVVAAASALIPRGAVQPAVHLMEL